MPPAANEVYIRIRLDGTLAMNEMKKIEQEASKSFKKVSGGLAAMYSFFYGGIARDAVGAAGRFGDLVGRGTPAGQVAAPFWAKWGAATGSAVDKTVESFGLAGKFADPKQILEVYKVHRQIEEMRAEGGARVKGVVGEAVTTEVLTSVGKDLKFAAKNFGMVTAQFAEVIKQLMKFR